MATSRPPRRRVQPVILVCDASGSMRGVPLASLQFFLQELLAHLKQRATEAPLVEVTVEVLTYAGQARWRDVDPVPVGEFWWTPLAAEGESALGLALALLDERLARAPRRDAFPPLLLLLTDGHPTDGWRPMLADLAQRPGFATSLRALVSFGPGICLDLVEGFLAPGVPLPRGPQAVRAWFPLPGALGWSPGRLDHPEQLLDALDWTSGG